MSAKPKLIDHDDRESAVRELGKNTIVIAGAGTGKTTLLVKRILRNLLIEQVPITRIAALTFTEKAANEMKLRLIETIEKLLTGEEIDPWLEETRLPAHAFRAMLHTILGDMDKAHISTIHSFCAHLLRLHPIEAGVVPDFQVDAGRFFDEFFEKQWNAWLNIELGRQAPRRDLWMRFMESMTLKNLHSMAEPLASFRIPLENIAAASKEPDQPEAIRTALELLHPFIASFRRAYLDAGWINFDGLLLLTRELLKRHAPARRRIKKEFLRLLVDEFQDTDPLQSEIIFYLAEKDDTHAERVDQVQLTPGKLFLVGDPKQSIYSFRGAHIEAYERAREHIEKSGGIQCKLTTNFRSHQGLVNVVNPIFEAVIGQSQPFQPDYVPISAPEDRKPTEPHHRVEMIMVRDPDKKLKADEARDIEAEAIVRAIKGLVGTATVEKHGERRPAQYKDIAVLFRKLSTGLTRYLYPFKRDDIPYVVEGEKFFYSTPEIANLLNLLAVLDNPHDRIALLGYLRSPYGGLTDREIYDLGEQNRLNYLDARPGLSATTEKIFAQLRRFRDLTSRQSLGELVHTLFEETFILEIAAGSFHGEQVVANLLKIESHARRMELEEGMTLKQFIRWLNRQVKEKEHEGESPLSDESRNAVRLLTIHKAKGLEFPIVIVADLHGQTGRGGPPKDPVEVTTEWPAYRIGVKVADLKNPAFEDIEKRQKALAKAEEKRNLYVAMTRARETMILTGSSNFRSNTYFGELSAALPEEFESGENRTLQLDRGEITLKFFHAPSAAGRRTKEKKEKIEGLSHPDWKRYHAFWQKRAVEAQKVQTTPWLVSPSMLQGAKHRLVDEQDEELREASSPALQLGSFCHRVMELWDFKEASLSATIDRVMREDMSVPAQTSLRDEAASMLAAFVRSEAAEELGRATILGREMPFVMSWKDQIVHGFIDVVYRLGKDVVVADYKTARVTPGKEAAKGEAYAAQKEIYSEAVRRVLGLKNVSFKLIFLRTGTMLGDD